MMYMKLRKLGLAILFPLALPIILYIWITTDEATLGETLDEYFDPTWLRK